MDNLLQEQIDYYRARAGEYDEWFLRRGRYDRGPELNRRWFAEVEHVCGELAAFRPEGRVLELACGTGQWTERLCRHGARLTAVDASPETITLNRARVRDESVRYVEADLFNWAPDGRYDVVFFGFWLSHVPPERFEAFWETVGAALAPGGRVFFVDSGPSQAGTAADQAIPQGEDIISHRTLNDGREFRAVKVIYDPARLQARLAALGWAIEVRATPTFFIYGHGTLS